MGYQRIIFLGIWSYLQAVTSLQLGNKIKFKYAHFIFIVGEWAVTETIYFTPFHNNGLILNLTSLLVDYFTPILLCPRTRLLLEASFFNLGRDYERTCVKTNYMLKNLPVISVLHKRSIQQLLEWHLFVGGRNNMWIVMLIARQFSFHGYIKKLRVCSSMGMFWKKLLADFLVDLLSLDKLI